MSETYQFTLTDTDGNEHHYETRAHPGGEGTPLAFKLMGLGVGPILEALKVVAAQPGFQEGARAMQGDSDAEDAKEVMAGMAGGVFAALAELDLSELRDALGELMTHSEIPDLSRQVLKYTTRDGKPLSQDLNWAKAWQRNYGEQMWAFVQVAVHNDFFPVARLFSGSSNTIDSEAA